MQYDKKAITTIGVSMDDVKNVLKLSNNNFIFVDIKKRNQKDIPILDMEEDIESNLLDDTQHLVDEINKTGMLK
jgi:glutaredoxin-related protein